LHDDILTQITRYIIIGLLGIIGYFIRDIINKLGDFEDHVQELSTKVAILLDRDRRKRLQDYDNGKTD
jgi:hypothetical protein